jgi:hypothetical protein
MIRKQTKLVTKREALRIVKRAMNEPVCIDVDKFCELLTWEVKLKLWLLQEKATRAPKQ